MPLTEVILKRWSKTFIYKIGIYFWDNQIDDIVVYANNLEDHGKEVRRLLKQLKEPTFHYNLKIANLF